MSGLGRAKMAVIALSMRYENIYVIEMVFTTVGEEQGDVDVDWRRYGRYSNGDISRPIRPHV